MVILDIILLIITIIYCQTWNDQRTKALTLALNKMLYPMLEQELIQKLKEEATLHFLQVTGLTFVVFYCCKLLYFTAQ